MGYRQVTHYKELTVLGGLPVKVAFTIERPDPSVGIWGGGVDEWWIVEIAGRARKEPKWLYKRIYAAGEEDDIICKCAESLNN